MHTATGRRIVQQRDGVSWGLRAGAAAAVLAIILVAACGGCSALNPQAQITDMQKAIMAQAVAALDSNGLAQTQTSGSAINPGVRVSAGIEYFAVARFDGVSGTVMSALHGQTGKVQPDVLAVLRNSQTSDDRKWTLVAEYLEEQRTAAAAAAAKEGGDHSATSTP